MQLSKTPLSVSFHESGEMQVDDVVTLKRNVEVFKRQVEREINELTEKHKEEIKRLYMKIQQQARTIEQYQSIYGKLTGDSPLKKQNQQPYHQTSSPKRSVNAQPESPTPMPNPTSIPSLTLPLPSSSPPIKTIITNTLDLNLRDEDFPPDEMYRSRYEERSRMKKQTEKEIYATLKKNRDEVEERTHKLLEMVGEKKRRNPEEEEIEESTNKEEQINQRRGRDEKKAEDLNTSMTFLCDSLDRSKEKSKSKGKKRPVQSAKRQQNPEEQRKKQGRQRLNGILRQMREKISVKIQSPKKTQIKTSKLLSTGHPGGSKVLINPVPLDLAKKNKNRGDSPQPLVKTVSASSILKNSSQGKFSRTIDGISAISKVTKQSSASKLMII